ncbi:MAG: hypothetical protein AB1921_07705 [Thermodesulfobacteriota bacterium]
MSLSAFEKRVRRHITGPEHEFFAATAPELAGLCAGELSMLFPDGRNIAAVAGGVEFAGKLPDLYRANLHLTSANRILMRVARFTAESFAELVEKAEDIPWELFLPAGPDVAVHVTTRKCRLHHTGAVAERISGAVSRRMQAAAPEALPAAKPLQPQAVYVRGVSDHFELSLDSSGGLLHKRGLLGESVRAPLRATLAASVLSLAGYDPMKPLLDPMCGAGTFSLEACLRTKNMPVGWFRNFSFTDWPGFSPAAFTHLRKKSREGFRVLPSPRIFASDIDPAAAESLAMVVRDAGMEDAARVAPSDFFLLDPREVCGGERGLVVINPPYGRRLSSSRDAEVLFFRIGQRLSEVYRGFRVAVLCPRRAWLSMLENLAWRKGPEIFPLRHGGLEVTLVAGELG